MKFLWKAILIIYALIIYACGEPARDEIIDAEEYLLEEEICVSEIEIHNVFPNKLSDASQITDTNIINNIKKSFCIVIADSLKVDSMSGNYILTLRETITQGPNGCVSYKYNDGILGTGFAIDPNKVVTASHVLKNYDIKDLMIVYDFILNDSVTEKYFIPKENCYEIDTIEYDGTIINNKFDFAILRLRKVLKSESIVRISNIELLMGHEIYVLGYPLGMGQKKSFGEIFFSSSLYNADEKYSFKRVYTSLYPLRGFSGAPIFSAKSNMFIGFVIEDKNGETIFLNIINI
jgi:V8-like Glu-specific endopeptidase